MKPYENSTDDETWSFRAYHEAMKRGQRHLVQFQDGDTIVFQDFFGFPKVTHDFEQQVHYWTMRIEGESHRMAEMLATRRFPGTKGTDRAFLQGREFGAGQFQDRPLVASHHLKMADDAGVSVVGKVYNGTLARFPGDPEAWVSNLGDVKDLCERRGWSADGAITVRAPQYAEPPDPAPYRVADDLVERYVDDAIATNPDLAPKRADVKEELTHKLAGIHGQ